MSDGKYFLLVLLLFGVLFAAYEFTTGLPHLIVGVICTAALFVLSMQRLLAMAKRNKPGAGE